MAVIADFGGYPTWVDSMERATVLRETDGLADEVEMVLAHPLFSDTYVLAYDWAPDRVSWHLVRGSRLTAMDGSYVLAPGRTGPARDPGPAPPSARRPRGRRAAPGPPGSTSRGRPRGAPAR